MILLKSKAEKELDSIISRLEMNMSNNYKDAARSDFKDLEIKFNELVSHVKINDKTSSKYERILEEYKEKLVGFSHNDQKPYWH